MAQHIRLTEYQRSPPLRLGPDQIAALQNSAAQIRIEAAAEAEGCFTLVPGSHVGIVALPGAVVEIRPKIPMSRLFFLLSYAMDPVRWEDRTVDLDADASVLEAVAPIFTRLVARATYRGLLHGYRGRDESALVVRGRWRIADQVRQRAGVMMPAEVSYDEFTEDILENRILLAALRVLTRLPLRCRRTRRALREVQAAFHAVSTVSFRPGGVPSVCFTRLNEHYRPAIELARLILQNSSLELGAGRRTGVALLLDMNEVVERFVHQALREALGLSEQSFPRGDGRLALDADRAIRMAPDLSWWHRGRCGFVGDVKYKRVNVPGVLHPDLYQLLAYTIAAGVDSGLLIYAAGEGEPARHVIPGVNKALYVEALDLAGSPRDVLGEVDRIAGRVRYDL